MAKVTYHQKKVTRSLLITYESPRGSKIIPTLQTTLESEEETVAIVLSKEELDLLIAALDYSGSLELTPMVTDFEGLRSKAFGEG